MNFLKKFCGHSFLFSCLIFSEFAFSANQMICATSNGSSGSVRASVILTTPLTCLNPTSFSQEDTNIESVLKKGWRITSMSHSTVYNGSRNPNNDKLNYEISVMYLFSK